MCIDYDDIMRLFGEGASKHIPLLAEALTFMLYRLFAGAIDRHRLGVLVESSDFVLLLDLLNI